ncbi:MAG: phage Gp37/Gp68 family protein [Alistipes sp.]|nr:phage Gp37/Gp68 family protein [Alistipes sp.]
MWNPWHGCTKWSEGCRNCYVYRGDSRRGRDASQVYRTRDFDLPRRKKRDGSPRLESGSTVYTCFTSDFFLREADPWRAEAWDMMRVRGDLHFFFITKRIERAAGCLPGDWGEGWENVTICCTVENGEEAARRLPVYLSLPLRSRTVICEPLLGPVDLSPHLGGVESVIVGGESGTAARPCNYDWVLSLREQCREAGVAFTFRQTGYRLVKDGRLYLVPRKMQHRQARKAGINLK